VNLADGAYGISAKAYDASGLTQAANINANKLLLSSGSGTYSLPELQLVRVYPVGNGHNATCPFNMAVDDSTGNIWTVNGNGNSGSNCSGPTNNLTKMVKASNYAPTVINNPQITASPEFVAADASGNIWVTVPTLTAGIFKLDASGNTVSGFPIGGSGDATCITPRGVDIDPTQTPNGAYVACYGGVDAPPADGGRKVLRLTSTGSVLSSYAFVDRVDQPVSISFARSFTQDSATIYNTDYNCNNDVFINRSSTSSVVISRLPLDLSSATLSTYVQASSDYNPYNMPYDGVGSIYPLARINGDILNLSYDHSYSPPMHLWSDNAGAALPAPLGIAIDDSYSFNNGGNCKSAAFSYGNLYIGHTTTNRVTRTANNQTIINDFIVGSTTNPLPRGVAFDHSSKPVGFIWVANSAEGTLSRINKHLFVLATDVKDSTPATCPASTRVGRTIPVSGAGFSTTAALNSVLVAGYVGTVTAATATSLTVTVPAAASGVTGPITVSTADGHAVSKCSYTTQ